MGVSDDGGDGDDSYYDELDGGGVKSDAPTSPFLQGVTRRHGVIGASGDPVSDETQLTRLLAALPEHVTVPHEFLAPDIALRLLLVRRSIVTARGCGRVHLCSQALL